jgi:hypothetical protein
MNYMMANLKEDSFSSLNLTLLNKRNLFTKSLQIILAIFLILLRDHLHILHI